MGEILVSREAMIELVYSFRENAAETNGRPLVFIVNSCSNVDTEAEVSADNALAADGPVVIDGAIKINAKKFRLGVCCIVVGCCAFVAVDSISHAAFGAINCNTKTNIHNELPPIFELSCCS